MVSLRFVCCIPKTVGLARQSSFPWSLNGQLSPPSRETSSPSRRSTAASPPPRQSCRRLQQHPRGFKSHPSSGNTPSPHSSLELQNSNLLHPTATPVALPVECIILLILARRVKQQLPGSQSAGMLEEDFRLVFIHLAEDNDIIGVILRNRQYVHRKDHHRTKPTLSYSYGTS